MDATKDGQPADGQISVRDLKFQLDQAEYVVRPARLRSTQYCYCATTERPLNLIRVIVVKIKFFGIIKLFLEHLNKNC